jgi:O-acetyl-ADP-ribose deacetylase (regulator of RNase III)
VSIDSWTITGFQKLNSSCTHSELFERVMMAVSDAPLEQIEQQPPRNISSLPSLDSSPLNFSKRLFHSVESPRDSASVAASEIAADNCSFFGTSLIRSHRVRGSNTLLCAVHGSVVFATTDAIVNAANQGCLGGGGVDGAVNDAGGPELEAARRMLPQLKARDGMGYVRCHTGDAVTTIGGNLHARLCIHAVGPNFAFHDEDGDALLSSAYAAAMRESAAHGVTSVAFSLLSASIFRATKPLKKVLWLGAAAVAQNVYEQCTHVLLCAYTEEECKELDIVFGELLDQGVLE